MNEITKRIQKARHELMEAEFALEDAELANEQYMAQLGVNWGKLGGNDRARRIAYLTLIADDADGQALQKRLRAAQREKQRAEVALESARDERRADENRSWAILADWCAGRVDDGDHAPIQTAQDLVKKRGLGEVLAETKKALGIDDTPTIEKAFSRDESLDPLVALDDEIPF